MATKKTTAKKTTTRKPTTVKKAGSDSATPQKPAAKKLSAIDAAAKVLAESKEPLNAKQMIERMAAKGYWKSPGGKTPHATLYAAIIRQIQAEGKEARFQKTGRGLFTVSK